MSILFHHSAFLSNIMSATSENIGVRIKTILIMIIPILNFGMVFLFVSRFLARRNLIFSFQVMYFSSPAKSSYLVFSDRTFS